MQELHALPSSAIIMAWVWQRRALGPSFCVLCVFVAYTLAAEDESRNSDSNPHTLTPSTLKSPEVTTLAHIPGVETFKRPRLMRLLRCGTRSPTLLNPKPPPLPKPQAHFKDCDVNTSEPKKALGLRGGPWNGPGALSRV